MCNISTVVSYPEFCLGCTFIYSHKDTYIFEKKYMILDLVMCKTPNLRQMHSMIYIFKKMACNYGTPYAGVQACDKTTNQICLFNLTFKDCLYLYFFI